MSKKIQNFIKTSILLSFFCIPLVSCDLITLNNGDLANEEKIKKELKEKETELTEKENTLAKKESDLNNKENLLIKKETDLDGTKKEIEEKQKELVKQKEEIDIKKDALEKEKEKESVICKFIDEQRETEFYNDNETFDKNNEIDISEDAIKTEENEKKQDKNNEPLNKEEIQEENVIEETKEENKTNEILMPEIKERLWNVLIYMPADNNLENSALEDIYEMECSKLNTDAVSVFFLIDRSNAYDTSEKNWSGTRLYRLNTGRKKSNTQMISEEIPCANLGLEVGKETELDMSSEYVLSNCMNYLRNKFPANNYGLIIWGHGTGWRSGNNDNRNDNFTSQLTKGFAYDETSKTYMTLKQLGSALNNSITEKKLNFLGFDTCFSGEIEVVYELQEYADYIVGSEGLVMSSGWNYTNIFNEISDKGFINASDICNCIVEQFKNEYMNTGGASIVMINSSEVTKYFKVIDDYLLKVAGLINSKKIRDDLIGILFSNKNCDTNVYTYGTENSDIYLDISSLVDNCYAYFESNYGNILSPYVREFYNEKEKCVINSWSFDSDDNIGDLGIFFSTITTGNLLSSFLPAAYIKGKTVDQILFVKNSNGYVPTSNESTSFLDKLFYKKF